MGYREVGGQKVYYKFNECEKGQVLVEGTYRKTILGKFGDQYEYMSDDGKIVVLNAAGQLAYKMDFMKEGTKCKIVYDGSIILEKGKMKGKSAHQFIVMAEENYGEEEIDEGLSSVEGLSDEGLDEFDEL